MALDFTCESTFSVAALFYFCFTWVHFRPDWTLPVNNMTSLDAEVIASVVDELPLPPFGALIDYFIGHPVINLLLVRRQIIEQRFGTSTVSSKRNLAGLVAGRIPFLN